MSTVQLITSVCVEYCLFFGFFCQAQTFCHIFCFFCLIFTAGAAERLKLMKRKCRTETERRMLMNDNATLLLYVFTNQKKPRRKDIKYASIVGRVVAMPTLVANLETRYELSAIFIPVCLQRLAENLLISRHALLSVCLYQSHNTHEGVLYRDYRDLSWFAANTCCIAILFVIPKKEKKTTASLVLILQHHTTLV